MHEMWDNMKMQYHSRNDEIGIYYLIGEYCIFIWGGKYRRCSPREYKDINEFNSYLAYEVYIHKIFDSEQENTYICDNPLTKDLYGKYRRLLSDKEINELGLGDLVKYREDNAFSLIKDNVELVYDTLKSIQGLSGSSTTTIEKQCKCCSKNNDLGVSSCWWCGVSNPTS